MSTFCLLAYIPCIIIAIWLLVEFRKFLIVNKRLKNIEIAWTRVYEQRKKQKSGTQFIETIPPPQAPRYPPVPLEEHYSHSDELYDDSGAYSRQRRFRDDSTRRRRDPIEHETAARRYKNHGRRTKTKSRQERRRPPRSPPPPPPPDEYYDNDEYLGAKRTRRNEIGKRKKAHSRKISNEGNFSYDEKADDVDWD